MPPTTTAPGRPHLVIGNFSNEMITLYHNEGTGLFVDEAPASAVGRESLLSLTFAMFFFDYDLDGRLDIFGANGHLDEEINNVQPNVQYAQPPLLFRNAGSGKFVRVALRGGSQGPAAGKNPTCSGHLVARGAAYGDYDRDGDLDLLISTNNGPAYLFRNDGGNANSYLRLKLVGEAIQPRRHRRRGPHQERLGRAVAGRPQRLELSVAERAAADVRPRQGRHRGSRGNRMAQREQQTLEQVEPNKMITIEEKPSPGASD